MGKLSRNVSSMFICQNNWNIENLNKNNIFKCFRDHANILHSNKLYKVDERFLRLISNPKMFPTFFRVLSREFLKQRIIDVLENLLVPVLQYDKTIMISEFQRYAIYDNSWTDVYFDLVTTDNEIFPTPLIPIMDVKTSIGSPSYTNDRLLKQ